MKRKIDRSEGKRLVSVRRFRLRYADVLLVLSGMLLMALIQVVFFHGGPGGEPSHSVRRPAAPKEGEKSAAPWGLLEYTPLALDRPADYFTNEVQRERTIWTLHDTSPADLAKTFASLQMDGTSREYLTNAAHWEPIPGGFRISPPPAVVIGLSPAARAALYDLLARYPENALQRTPFQFRNDGFEEWFGQCGLKPEKLAIVRRLTYTHSGILCFADAPTFSEIATPAETMCLVRALWRVSTFILSVRVGPGTDVRHLMDYWDKAGRAQQYRPMLDAICRGEEQMPVTISYFLPAFARMRLYTYPPPNDTRAIREDCFWSAMNFFNETPDDRFFNPDEIQRALREEYVRVPADQKAFGDTLLLLGSGGRALHMCIYIADDVVFTKNGFITVQPWILMKLNEMLGSYEMERPFEVTVYRRKTVPGAHQAVLSARINQ